MSVIKAKLSAVTHISNTSVFLVPEDGFTLDFKTISSVPHAHRAILQKNGLIAKVCMGLTNLSAQQRQELEQSVSGLHSSSDVHKMPLFDHRTRRELWRDVLSMNEFVKAGSGNGGSDALIVPRALRDAEWPLLNERQYNDRVTLLKARSACTEINESTYCVPILAVQESLQKYKNMTVWMAVAWMPRYPMNLMTWGERFLGSGTVIPEVHLLSLCHHLVFALTTLHKLRLSVTGVGNGAGGNGGGSHPKDSRATSIIAPEDATSKRRVDVPVAALNGGQNVSEEDRLLISRWFPTNFDWTHVLVWDEEGGSGNAPRFVVSASLLRNTALLRAAIHDAETGFTHLQDYPTLAPEQVGEAMLPIRLPKYELWALGMVLYALACGGVAALGQRTRSAAQKGEHPLNHPSTTPTVVAHRVRGDLEPGAYSSTLPALICLLLAHDHHTRPSLATLEATMQDLDRPTPIRRFPFALGSIDLLRLPTPGAIQLDLAARRYMTSHLCCVCKKPRNGAMCKVRDHAPAPMSPPWTGSELLPGLVPRSTLFMTYLYPLLDDSLDERARRRLLMHTLHVGGELGATQSSLSSDPGTDGGSGGGNAAPGQLDRVALFQQFGGFAIFGKSSDNDSNGGGGGNGKTGKKGGAVVVREVLVPYPAHALLASETQWVAQRLHLAAGLPWPACCTRQLQQKGRVVSQVPFLFRGSQTPVRWFAWLVPGEKFILDSGEAWVAAEDGGFVVWFSEDLEPTDLDRYFALTSVRSLTVRAKVNRTRMPDNIFRLHLGNERPHLASTASHSLCHSLSHIDNSYQASESGTRRATLSGEPATSGAKRRSTQHVSMMHMPTSAGIVEDDDATRLNKASTNPSPMPHDTPFPTSPKSTFAASLTDRSAVLGPGSNSGRDRVRHSVAKMESIPNNTATRPRSREKAGRPTASTAGSAEDGKTHTACAAPPRARSPLSPDKLHIREHTRPSAVPFTSTSKTPQSLPAVAKTTPHITNGSNPHHTATVPTTARHIPFSTSSPVRGGGMTALSPVTVTGRFYAADVISAPYRTLTFFVPSTGEHGFLQEPVALTDAARTAFHAPQSAVAVAFLSNHIPLLRCNHTQFKLPASAADKERTKAGQRLLLPCHGFVFYDAEQHVDSVLALRVVIGTALRLHSREFVLPLLPQPTQYKACSAADLCYISYFDGSGDDTEADATTKGPHKTSAAGPNAGILTHPTSPPSLSTMKASRAETPVAQVSHPSASLEAQRLSMKSDHTVLTFTSGFRFVQATPTVANYEEFYASVAEMGAPCWMSFHPDSLQLLFSDTQRQYWHPYALDVPRDTVADAPTFSPYVPLHAAGHHAKPGQASAVAT